MKIDWKRIIFAALEGTGQWLSLSCCILISVALISYYDATMPGTRDRIPYLAKAADAFIPDDRTAMFIFFTLPGLVWCSWLNPRPAIEVFTRFYAGVGMILIAMLSPAFLSISGVLGQPPSAPFYHIQTIGEAVYVAFCFLPLIIAAISHRCRSHV